MTASCDSLQPPSVGAPIVAIHAAVTDPTVDIGDELHIARVCFVQSGWFNVKMHPERALLGKVADDG